VTKPSTELIGDLLADKTTNLISRPNPSTDRSGAPGVSAEDPAGALRKLGGVLVQHRREICACRLVVETDGHQRHLVLEAQSMLQTPAEQLAVARRQQKAAAGKPRRGANQSLRL